MESDPSDDEAFGGESMDFCIADTQQVDATSAVARGSGHGENGRDFNFSCTQVDDGLPSDDDEDYQHDENGYGGTQVDEDFFERMMEEYDISPLGKAGAASTPLPVAAKDDGRRRSVGFADEVAAGNLEGNNERADVVEQQVIEVQAEPEEPAVHNRTVGKQLAEDVGDDGDTPQEDAPQRSNSENSSTHNEQNNGERDAELQVQQVQPQDEDEGAQSNEGVEVAEDDGDLTQGGDCVDFCIADTQAPLSYPHPPSAAPAPVPIPALPRASVEAPAASTTTAEPVPGPSGLSAQSPVAILEDTHLTVYDYLSLSAPVSAGESAKGVISAHISSTPNFSAIDASPAEANTVGSTAYGTARTGPRTGSTSRTAAPGVGPFKLTGDTPEEEPTQLDGSSMHDASGDSPVPDRLQDSETHASAPFSAEKTSNRDPLRPSLASPAAVARPAADMLAAAPTAGVAVVDAAMLDRMGTSSEFGMDWITTKAPKVTAGAAYVAYQAPASVPVPAAARVAPVPAPAAVQNTLSPRAAASAAPVVLATTEAQLEDRSLEDLLQMQERLQHLIQAKAAQHAGIAAAPAASTANAAATVTGTSGTSPARPSAPLLQRQDTSYGMSQPTNLAISGLIRLRNDPASAALDTTSSSSSSSPRAAAPAPMGVFSPASPATTTTAAVTTAPTSATSAATPSNITPSPTKKFFRRKFAGGKSPAAQGTADKDAIAAEMFAHDDIADDASSGGEHDNNSAQSTKAKVSPAKVTFHLQPAARPEKTAAPKRPPAGIGRASASRVIRDTDDAEFDADDDEVEFEDANMAATSAAQSKKAKPAGSNVSTASDNAVDGADAGATEDSAARAQLPADVPPSLLYHLPSRFAELWPTLTALGWYWKRGGGIVSYYYIRPNCAVKKGFFQGKDYFADEQEVQQFVSAVVMSCRKLLPALKLPVPQPAPAVEVIRSTGDVGKDSAAARSGAQASAPAAAQGKSATARGGGGKTEASAAQANASHSKTAAPASASSTQFVPSQHPRALASLPSTHSVLQLPDDPIMHDINRIPWKWLWKILRDKDWTWDFGPQHCNYYFAPGYDLRSKEAVMGEHKFDSEDSVRRFVRKQNWPEFQSGALERQSSAAAESQPLDAYLHDPSWKLASHRRKRESAASSRGENRSGSDSESSDGEARAKSDGGASKKMKIDARQSLGNVKASKTAAAVPAKAAAAAAGVASDHSRHSQAVHATKPPLPPSSATLTVSAAARLSRHDSDFGLATQPQNASQVSPLAKKRPAESSRRQGSLDEHAVAPAVTTFAEQQQLFAGRRYVVSGVPERLKEHLVREISRRGGTILDAVPADGDEGQDELALVEKTGQRVRKGCVVVVSHPKECRKLNYLMALATGVALVHHQWVRDSLDRGALQPFAAYLLPSGCTALHGYNIFAAPRPGSLGAEAAGGGGLGPALSPSGDGGILANVKVLNFAGRGWDNLLLASGATTVQNSAVLVQSLQKLASTPSAAQAGHRQGGAFGGRAAPRIPVDVILVDPYEYATAVTAAGRGFLTGGGDSLLTAGGGRFTTPTAASHSTGPSPQSGAKSPAVKMSDAELAAVHACARLQAASRQGYSSGSVQTVPAVVTTDWLVHCLAVGYVLDHHLLDVFTPPEEPDRKPFTYKADSVTGTGERYTKHDIVSYSTRSGPAKPVPAERGARESPANATNTQETLAMGKILGFTRRDMKSPLFARIRPLVPKSSVSAPPAGHAKRGGGAGVVDAATEHLLHKELIGCPSTAVAMVEVERLCGKVVLLCRQDFERVHYGALDNAVFFASPEWIAENPCALVGEEDGDDSQGVGDGMRIQRSQDY